MNARIVLVFFIILVMLLYDPIVVMIALTVFTVAYVILFKFVRTRLERNGKHISDMLAERFKLMNDAFGGIKDILLLGRSSNFKKQFFKTGNKLAYSEGNNSSDSTSTQIFYGIVSLWLNDCLGFVSNKKLLKEI